MSTEEVGNTNAGSSAVTPYSKRQFNRDGEMTGDGGEDEVIYGQSVAELGI